MGNITLSHLMDRNLYPFTSLQATGVASADGDIAFDEEPCDTPRPATVQLHRAPVPDDSEP
jgi:tRNA 2-thiocytidine biosynthesis protein TtcA